MSTPLLKRLAQRHSAGVAAPSSAPDEIEQRPAPRKPLPRPPAQGPGSSGSAPWAVQSSTTSWEASATQVPAVVVETRPSLPQPPGSLASPVPPRLVVESPLIVEPAPNDGPCVVAEPPVVVSPRSPSAPALVLAAPGARDSSSAGEGAHGRSTTIADEGLGALLCHDCGRIIAGRVVRAVGKRWHPSCFRCQHCDQLLEHVAFYEHEGRAYCGVDYDELFALQCHHCHTPITDEAFVSLEDPSLPGGPRHYHQLHLFCAECGDPFVDPKSLEETSRISKRAAPSSAVPQDTLQARPFVLHRGYPYCERCHLRLHKPKCSDCKQPMAGDIVKALGRQWHPECFACKACGNGFPTGAFFEVDGAPFCDACASQLKRSRQSQ